MSDIALTLRQLGFENKIFWRNPAAVGFTFAFPLMFLVLFNALFGESQFFVPAIAAFSVISACYTNIAISTAFARDQGVLKRKRGTPMPPSVYMLARVLHATAIGLLLVVIVAVAGTLFYDVDLPTDTMPAFLVALLVGAAAFSALGLAITAFVPNADAAPPIVNFSILPLLFISDIFLPSERAPEWLTRIADVFPVKHFAQAMASAFNPGRGSGWEPGHLAIVILWGVVGVFIAVRFFTWEPRR
ncbi:MAG TPA: ABC transporter permease [Actinomycetota bacterium]|nr:ABC transporter permease [Actinomycetota bacterium]